MLPELNMLLGSIIALALLVGCIVAPFLFLWVVLSMRRDLSRIADSLDSTARRELAEYDAQGERAFHAPQSTPRGITFSAFGR